MKKELKTGILSADKSADGRPTVGGVNVIAVFLFVLPQYYVIAVSNDMISMSIMLCGHMTINHTQFY